MAVLVSEGRLVALADPRDYIRRDLELNQEIVSYAELYRRQPNVRTVISFLAENIAQIGIHAFRRTSDTDRERLYGHDVERAIARPNPRTTRRRLIEATVSDIAIWDFAMWVKVPGAAGGPPVALVRIPPTMVTPDGGSWLWPDGYKVKGNKADLTIPWEATVVFPGYSPTDNRWGSSPLEALRGILAEEAGATSYRESLWKNSAKVSGVLERPKDAPTWSPDAKKAFRSSWQRFWSGQGAMIGGTPILEDGMTYRPIAMTSRDAEYLGARKLTREEVAAAYHVQPTMVGILDHATFSNISAQHVQMYQDTFGPWFERIQGEIELQLVPDFADTDNVYLEFNIAEKLAGSFEEQASSMQTMVGAPVMSRNEGRARLNLPRVDDAEFDKPITPLNMSANPSAPGAPPTDAPAPPDTQPPKARRRAVKARPTSSLDRHTATLAKHFERQGQVIASRLGAAKARGAKADIGDVFDLDRWNRELHAVLGPMNIEIGGAAAKAAAAQLEVDDYNDDVMAEWLDVNATKVAAGINDTTRDAIAGALAGDDPGDAVKRIFEVLVGARAAQIVESQTSAISGFASRDVAKHGGYATKTWVVASARPRASHAALDGVSVDIDGTFPNGARWPGDSSLPDDERAGCTCDMTFERE